MLALATTQEGDVPLFLRPLDGNSSDTVSLASAVEALHEQLQAPESEPSVFVADSGVYSEANMRRFNEAKIRWISRVPETSTEAKAVVEAAANRTEWQDSEDGQTHWFTQTMTLPQGQERWVVVRTEQGEARAQATLKRQGEKAEHSWKQKLWHLSNQHFACEADAQSALARALKGLDRDPFLWSGRMQRLTYPLFIHDRTEILQSGMSTGSRNRSNEKQNHPFLERISDVASTGV